MVQWLTLHAFNAGDTGLIPGQGIKVPHAVWCGQKKKKLEKIQDNRRDTEVAGDWSNIKEF